MKKIPKRNRAANPDRLVPVLVMTGLLAWAGWSLETETTSPSSAPSAWGCVAGRDGGVAVVARDQRPEADPVRCPAAVSYILGLKFDLNLAGVEDLERLPGLGTKTAAEVLAFRERSGRINSLSELEGIAGLDPRARASLSRWTEVR